MTWRGGRRTRPFSSLSLQLPEPATPSPPPTQSMPFAEGTVTLSVQEVRVLVDKVFVGEAMVSVFETGAIKSTSMQSRVCSSFPCGGSGNKALVDDELSLEDILGFETEATGSTSMPSKFWSPLPCRESGLDTCKTSALPSAAGERDLLPSAAGEMGLLPSAAGEMGLLPSTKKETWLEVPSNDSIASDG